MRAPCPWGPPAQVLGVAEYPCPAGCGCHSPSASGLCLGCWYAAHPLDDRVANARRLPADHPRRQPAPGVLSGG